MATPSPAVDRARPERATEPAAFVWICLAAVFLFTASRLTSSLWLDETATYWVAKDGLSDVVSRSWAWSGQSPLYYFQAWVSLRLAGVIGMEAALRLPSLLDLAAAAFLIARLGRYLMDARTGAVAALAFVSLPAVWFAAIDARPYALGLLVVVASTFCFFKWLDTGRASMAVLYVLTVAMVVYAHYLFALALAPQVAWGLRRRRAIAGLWAASAALCLPLITQVLYFYRTRHSHSFAPDPALTAIFNAIIPPILAAAVLLSILARKQPEDPAHMGRPIPWSFVFTWLIFPPAFLAALSISTDTKLFVTRYYLSAAPAAALIAAYVIARCSTIRLASGMLLASTALSVWSAGRDHGGEDWRGAMGAVRRQAAPQDMVLASAPFVEGETRLIHEPMFRDVLFSPQLAYPVASFARLPFGYDATAIPADLARSSRVFLVARRATPVGYVTGYQYAAEIGRRLEGYRATEIGPFEGIYVVRYDRAPETRP